jgi:hypothetical protein
MSGDRLHFGAAVERAKVEGLRVEVVVVGDDCALDEKAGVGRRGIAGALLVHKVGEWVGRGDGGGGQSSLQPTHCAKLRRWVCSGSVGEPHIARKCLEARPVT